MPGAWLCIALLPFASDVAGDDEASSLEERIERLEEGLDAVERRLAAPADEMSTDGARDAVLGEAVEWTPVWDRESLETARNLRGVYDKPFLATVWRRAHVGGYTEFEYHSFEDGTLGIPEGFRMHRTNLFLFADVSDRVRFGSEFEFETEFEGEGVSDDIELKVEMAFIDWILFEELVLRGGAILVPLGRVNVNHDGPVRELTERPLVSTFVIPTTLTEAGVGAHGALSLGDVRVLYESYAVNGFQILDEDGGVTFAPTEQEQALREGRSSIGGDPDGGVAWTGRAALEWVGAVEVGASWHYGTYDERADNFLTLLAGDLSLTHELGGADLALEGEIARAHFQRDDFARTAGIPDEFWGYYVQGSVGGMPQVARELLPGVLDDDGASFALVFRHERVDLAGDRGEVLEPGASFRPTADTVFKFSYRFTQKGVGVRSGPGRDDFDDDGFVFSMTTYF